MYIITFIGVCVWVCVWEREREREREREGRERKREVSSVSSVNVSGFWAGFVDDVFATVSRMRTGRRPEYHVQFQQVR